MMVRVYFILVMLTGCIGIASQPNIVVILADDLSAEGLGRISEMDWASDGNLYIPSDQPTWGVFSYYGPNDASAWDPIGTQPLIEAGGLQFCSSAAFPIPEAA